MAETLVQRSWGFIQDLLCRIERSLGVFGVGLAFSLMCRIALQALLPMPTIEVKLGRRIVVSSCLSPRCARISTLTWSEQVRAELELSEVCAWVNLYPGSACALGKFYPQWIAQGNFNLGLIIPGVRRSATIFRTRTSSNRTLPIHPARYHHFHRCCPW